MPLRLIIDVAIRFCLGKAPVTDEQAGPIKWPNDDALRRFLRLRPKRRTAYDSRVNHPFDERPAALRTYRARRVVAADFSVLDGGSVTVSGSRIVADMASLTTVA